MTTRRPRSTASRPRPQRRAPRQRRWPAILGSERLFVAALFVFAVVVVAMLLDPVQRFVVASERVDELAAQKAELTAQVEKLEERRARLQDPRHVELLAREQLGLVKPGEIPYVVTGEQPPPERLRAIEPTADVEPKSWWERVAAAFAKLFRRPQAR